VDVVDIMVLWVFTPFIIVGLFWYFRGTNCLHLQGGWICFRWLFPPWRDQHVPSKCQIKPVN